jgi:hypothetical protein
MTAIWGFLSKGGWIVPVAMMAMLWFNRQLALAETRGRLKEATEQLAAQTAATRDSSLAWAARDSVGRIRDSVAVVVVDSLAGAVLEARARRPRTITRIDSVLVNVTDTVIRTLILAAVDTLNLQLDRCEMTVSTCQAALESVNLTLADARGEVLRLDTLSRWQEATLARVLPNVRGPASPVPWIVAGVAVVVAVIR